MTLLPFALLLIAAVLGKWVFAAFDFRKILRDMGGPDQKHAPLVLPRMLVCLFILIPVTMFDGVEGWQGAAVWGCYVGIMWSSVTISHRSSLNTLRKMDWRYISPGNWFDRQCIRICAKEWKGVKWEKDHHNLLYNGSQEAYAYRDEIHRAGLLSYIAIALVLALSLGGAVWILN